MTPHEVSGLVRRFIREYESGAISFPRFVAGLETLVDPEARADSWEKQLFRCWGRLEILNAFTVADDINADADRNAAAKLIAELRLLLEPE